MSIAKKQGIEYHPFSNITDTGPIESNTSGTGEEYLDLAKTQLFVKAKITKANGDNLDPNTQFGPGIYFYIPCFHKRMFLSTSD